MRLKKWYNNWSVVHGQSFNCLLLGQFMWLVTTVEWKSMSYSSLILLIIDQFVVVLGKYVCCWTPPQVGSNVWRWNKKSKNIIYTYVQIYVHNDCTIAWYLYLYLIFDFEYLSMAMDVSGSSVVGFFFFLNHLCH